jgi:hypothetical protein
LEEPLSESRPRVLIAGTPPAIDKLSAILGTGFEVLGAQSVGEALGRVDADIDLILCNVRFDDSRMFDFLQALKERPHRAPVICCRVFPPKFSPPVRQAIDMAVKALEVTEFVDLQELEQQLGGAPAGEKLRELVQAHLPAHS